jgi:D-inositol-3-phosphate glycosyltransferase
MASEARRAIAVISVHASPVAPLGRGENGGMNLAIRRICEGLSERGVPTDVYVRRDSRRGPDEELIARQSRVVRLRVGPPARLPKDDVRFLCDDFAAAVRDHARSEGRDYRAIHGHYWLGGLVARGLRDAWGVAWVQSFHTLARTKARAGLPLDVIRARAEDDMVAGADRLVASSVSEAKDLIRLYGASRERICVAQPGVDLRRSHARAAAELRRSLRLEGRRVVLFACRLEPLKGASTLLDAIAVLSASSEFSDVRVLVVGDDSGDGAAGGGERRRLEERVRNTRLAGRVRFLSAVPHERLPDYYAVADVCVVPSLTESFGLVALEAQALGTPVVAAAVGGLTEVVEDEVTGLLVPGRDPQSYADALERLLRDSALRRRMGEEAQRRASGFTWSRAVDRLAAIYSRVGAEHAAGASPCGEPDAEVPVLSAS